MTTAQRIGLVRYHNFGPYEDAEIDFSVPGLTGIEGVISWKPGSNSNGSGKSYLVDGPAWCLWGRCLRPDYKGDEVVRIGSKGGTSVETNIVGGDCEIRVVRYRQHPKCKNRVYLFINGKDVTRGTDVETQAEIDRLFMDFTAAQNSIFFAARDDVRSFFTAPDAQRKAIFDQIMGLEIYADAEKVARRRLVAVREALAPLAGKRAKAQAALDAQTAILVEIESEGDVETLRFDDGQARLRVRRLESAVVSQKATVDAEVSALSDAQSKASVGLKTFQLAHDQYIKAKSDAERTLRTAHAEMGGAEAVLARAQSAVKRHGTQAGKTCSACGQALSAATHQQVVENLQRELAQAESAKSTAQSALSTAQSTLTALKEPVRPTFQAVELADEVVAIERSKLSDLNRDLGIARERRDGCAALLERATTQLNQTRGKIDEYVTEIAALIEQMADKERQSERLAYWVEGFGNQGVKSFLIESEVASISTRASQYGQRLLGTGATVKLSATTALKSTDAVREKLSVDVCIPGCTVTYAGASKGQKRRLDLALLLAFRDIVAERSVGAFRQFFADELFDGLDQTGTEFVIDLLRDIASNDCPVIVVTHNLALKSAVDRVLTVRHEGPYLARLVKPGTPVKKKLISK